MTSSPERERMAEQIAAAYQPPSVEASARRPTLAPEFINFPGGHLGLGLMSACGPLVLFSLAIVSYHDPYSILGIAMLSVPMYLLSCGAIAATLPGGIAQRFGRFVLTSAASVLGYLLIFPVCMVSGRAINHEFAVVLALSASHMITVFTIGLIVRSSVRDAMRQRVAKDVLESVRQT